MNDHEKKMLILHNKEQISKLQNEIQSIRAGLKVSSTVIRVFGGRGNSRFAREMANGKIKNIREYVRELKEENKIIRASLTSKYTSCEVTQVEKGAWKREQQEKWSKPLKKVVVVIGVFVAIIAALRLLAQ